MVNVIAKGLYSEPGLSPPELVGRDEACYDFIFDYLAARGVRFEVTEEDL
jgi:lysine 6-dehydrogenase